MEPKRKNSKRARQRLARQPLELTRIGLGNWPASGFKFLTVRNLKTATPKPLMLAFYSLRLDQFCSRIPA